MKKIWKQASIHHLIQLIKAENASLQRRFIAYIVFIVALILTLILFLLNFFGIMNPSKANISNNMNSQLITSTERIAQDYSEIAAYAVSFSKELENTTHDYLLTHNIKFKDLKNDKDNITALQAELYDTVYLHLQLAQCSGAFYIFDTTVNSESEQKLYNGLYLKYINLNSESTVNNAYSLYRGSFETGKEHDISFHSGWHNEMETDFFDTYKSTFVDGIHYALSPEVEIPNTWEFGRYVYVPIHDFQNNVIGVCGFEINDLMFQLMHKTEADKIGQFGLALLEKQGVTYSGQFNTRRYGNPNEALIILDRGDMDEFKFAEETAIGKSKDILLGNQIFTVAVMLPKAQYDAIIQQGQTKMVLTFFFVACFAFLYCIIMSKRYVSPILDKINAFISDEDQDNALIIREIDDLFTYLEERDNQIEEKLKILEKEKQNAETEAEESKIAYENALQKYKLAKLEMQQLSEEYQKEIVVEDYEYFTKNLSMLTSTEYHIYELYLAGHKGKEIASMLNITENTLKYHNKNIYSKLGISSRKQLLRFATLKQHQDKMKDHPDL